MNITFDELRHIKHSLPHGSVSKIAQELNRNEQDVRNFFGAQKGISNDWHLEPGPDGGVINVKDTTIYEAAKRILLKKELQ